MRVARIVVALSLTVAAATLSGCGDNSGAGSSAVPATGASGEAAPAAGRPAAPPFGPACGSVPADGPGSFNGMAADPVATAASHNPALSKLSAAIQKANLVDKLNSAQNITVFAPADSAFDQLPRATTDRILNGPDLAKILTYHVIDRRVSPTELEAGNFASLEGATVSTSGSGQNFKINGNASVVCGNVQTANATVYIIDSLLMPPGR